MMQDFKEVRLDRLFFEAKDSIPMLGSDLELLTPSTIYGIIPQSHLKSRPQQALRDNYEIKPADRGDFVISMSSFKHGFEY